MAASAARAGWSVLALDAFGDLDLRACAHVRVVRRDDGGFDPAVAAASARELSADAVAYTSNFENHPAAVAALAAGRRLLGNPSGVLERVREPVGLMLALRRDGFATPATRTRAPHAAGAPRRWLLKPRRSGGGHGTSAWRPGVPVSRHQYLQERIAGTPGSIAFLADGGRAVALGLSRQMVGERTFGASGFRYCGSLVAARGLFAAEQALLTRASAMAQAVTREFGLVGLNGIDFIARAGVPWPIEVNPRWSASMELLDRRQDTALFTLHAEACGGRLPVAKPAPVRGVLGKAVVFARRDVSAGDSRGWLRDPAIADVPHPGERIPRGRPICTVFASASTLGGCRRALASRAAAIYRSVEPAARGAA
jgi:hypothetical protein